MQTIDLNLQPLGPQELAALLVSPALQASFAIPTPVDLMERYSSWRRRFLQHHSGATTPVPAHVVEDYGQQLVNALNSWFQQPAWAPLHRALRLQPGRPLRIRVAPALHHLEPLPWEALPLDRPIWRLPPIDPPLPIAAARQRRPRLLLVVGDEQNLNLDREIAGLIGLAQRGQLHLHQLRGATATPSRVRDTLEAAPGWDGLIFLGHSDGDRDVGGRLQLGDGSWISGASFEHSLRRAADLGLKMVLLNSCSGVDLAHRCLAAGIAWVQCFREPVPSEAAATTFTWLLRELEAGHPFAQALETTIQHLHRSAWPDCQWLLSAYGHPEAEPFQLPTPGQRLQRRELLLLAGGTAAAALGGTAAGWGLRHQSGRIHWRLATYLTRKENHLLVGQAPEHLKKRLHDLTDGRFVIDLVEVPNLSSSQILKRVNSGLYACGYCDIYYDKILQPMIFSKAVPFGLTPREQIAWLNYKRPGEAIPFHQSVYPRINIEGAPLDNLRSFPLTCTGGQTGGWFKKELHSLDDLEGLRMRIPGLGAEVLNTFGVQTDFTLNNGRTILANEISNRLRNNHLDAGEWIGPHDDEVLGLHKQANYYYSPGWWEPSTTNELMVNKQELQKLSKDHRVALEMACQDTYMHIVLNYDLTNIPALERLRKQGIQLRRFNEPMMAAFQKASTNHLDQMAVQSEDFAYVYSEWKRFRDRFRATTRFTQFEPS